jgi:FtsH-binding integral membrane protein
MPNFSRWQASIYAAFAFLLTLVFSYFLPNYVIVLSGLLVVIFLSVFVKDNSSTIIAGIVSAFTVLAHIFFKWRFSHALSDFATYVFILLLILLTTLIVLYIKKLILKMQFDKSHMKCNGRFCGNQWQRRNSFSQSICLQNVWL